MSAVGAGVQGAQVRNQEATVWVGGIDDQATEEILFELFINAGPVVSVSMPKDKITGAHGGYAFVEFETVEDAEYCLRIMSNVKLYQRHLKMNRASGDKGTGASEEEYNAKLFIGNLDMSLDEKALFDHFSQFGAVLSAKIMTEPETGKSRGFGFLTYDSFESSDRAIECMNGQYLGERPISVNYAFKKDGSGTGGNKGERHGSAAERELAAKSAAHRIRTTHQAPIVQGPVVIPGYLGGRAVNLPPPPPSNMMMMGAHNGMQPMIPPPPPAMPLPSHLQHHPSRGIPGYGGPSPQFSPPPPPPSGFYTTSMPPPPPNAHFAPPPPPQMYGNHYGGAPPPPQFAPPPPPGSFVTTAYAPPYGAPPPLPPQQPMMMMPPGQFRA